MSRVSDALQRAAKERAQVSSTPVGYREPYWIEPRKNGGSTEEDTLRSPLITQPKFFVGAKTWRDRIEEFFFGWDLRRLKSHPVVALERDSAAAEQYKILREQVRTLRDQTSGRFISITSPLKHDGKTMVAVNLAAALALGGEEQVLLIDGDLRSPDVHKYFGVERYPGLADYLTSRSNGNLSSYVRPTSIPGLQILPAGNISDTAAELLASGRMKRLMEEIRSTYPKCQVIIDSPPVLATSDPLVLAREVAGVIMVVRAGKTRREYLKKAIEILNSPKLMGIVLNGAQLGTSLKHYHYTYTPAQSGR